MGAPVGEVEEGVEILLHPGVLIAPEVAPRVVVHEARRRDPGARRVGAQLPHLLFRQRPVDGLELVILVLAHHAPPGGRSLPSIRARRLASFRAAFFASFARPRSSIGITTAGRALPNLFSWAPSKAPGRGCRACRASTDSSRAPEPSVHGRARGGSSFALRSSPGRSLKKMERVPSV